VIESILPLIGMMAIMVAVLFLAYFLTRWIAVHGAPNFAGGRTDDVLGVLRQVNVGRTERLLLVRLNDRCLLVGVTSASMCVLAELSKEESEQWLQAPGTASFMETLQSAASKIPKKK